MAATVTCLYHDFAPVPCECGVYECTRCGALGRRVRGAVVAFRCQSEKRNTLEAVDTAVHDWAASDVRAREDAEARRDAQRS